MITGTMSRLTLPDFGDLPQRMDRATLAFAEETVNQIQARWTGWRAGSGKSQRAWEATAREGRVVIVNDAGYTPYVHRAGSRTPEVEVIQREVIDPRTPVLVESLNQVIFQIGG